MTEEEKKQDLLTAHNFIMDLWKFMKTNYFVSSDPAYWVRVIHDGNEILAKHKSDSQYQLFKRLVFACIDDWEKQLRKEGEQ